MPSIDQVTRGYSSSGASAYLNDLNAKAIDETKQLLSKVDPIIDAVRAGWAGKSEEVFEQNLYTAVQRVQESLEQCKAALEQQIGDIESAMDEFDNNLVPPL